jgi:CheY-like chemotaxis protein
VSRFPHFLCTGQETNLFARWYRCFTFGVRALLKLRAARSRDCEAQCLRLAEYGGADFEVICDAADGLQAVREAERLQPNVVVLDITMPGMDGFEAASHIRKVASSIEIVFLSQNNSLESVKQAFRHGGRGYVLKTDAFKELIPAVRVRRNSIQTLGLPPHEHRFCIYASVGLFICGSEVFMQELLSVIGH